MQITFTPSRRDDMLTLAKAGDTLTINGAVFDFGPLSEGAELPPEAVACAWIAGPVRREGGALHLSLILPHGPNAPEAAKFPAPITVQADGPIALPAYTVTTDEDGQAQEVHGETPSVTTEGAIDWSQMLTAQAREAARYEAWREGASLPRVQLAIALQREGLIDEVGMVDAASGRIPAELSGALDGMDAGARAEVVAHFAGSDRIARSHPFVTLIEAEGTLATSRIDEAFGWQG